MSAYAVWRIREMVMIFNIKRFIYGVSKRRFWLLLILLPPIYYIVVSAGAADRHAAQFSTL